MWTIIREEDGWICWTIHERVCPRQLQTKRLVLTPHSSHLLLHDDSISTRLVSYILYLPNSPVTAPSDDLTPSQSNTFLKGWNPSWGGSLELYPVENDVEVGPPLPKRSTKEDVKWGQIVFFEVKPGRSYHAVEEVIVGDGRQRLGVSGW